METAQTPDIRLRPVASGDRELLLEIYEASREIELGMVQWQPQMKRAFLEHQFEAQKNFYETKYPNVSHEIILVDNQAAGRLFLSRGNLQIAILDITVLPQFRQRGIAASILGSLKSESRSSGKGLRVFVEPFNPSRFFFEKRGFVVVEETPSNRRYEWHP